jgi:multiple sugar transport system permease protein
MSSTEQQAVREQDLEEEPPRPDDAPEAGGVLGRRGAAAFVAPAFGLIGLFLVFPALWTLYLAVTNMRLTGLAAADPEFVGLENFVQVLTDPEFLNSLYVTLLFVLGSAVIGQTFLGFTLAWVLRGWQGALRQGFEVLVIIAWIIPASVVAFLWIAFLDAEGGTLNAISPVNLRWLLDYPLLSIIVFNVWRGTAFSMLLFGAALGSMPPSHLETARLAGASFSQQLRDVVVPSIRGHILTALLLISLWTFNLFTPFLITGGGPGSQTETLPIYIYNTALSAGRLGYGAAISAIMLVINLMIALIYLRVVGKRDA